MSTSDGLPERDDRSVELGEAVTGLDLTAADERILAYLDRAGPDYPALVAGNTGLHVAYVEKRIAMLAAAGFLEPVSGEVIYRITDPGHDALHGT
ncbi:DUF2250 domain-containing protein [Halorubrum vacuolatum]|uniref:DUF2250 domain-containing protein n=1 Tax=Halorubrum vacuolatum TaxID=63740 RepID=A0A238WVB1_HALVU|nr:DUF2250 domain-containing protein [Halorubrum vacuolatum]SNR50383.1 Uncharacterized protein SAMN06264855_11086 [Halorubrum vacuolatum]